ncbi:MAG TPA: hypothetical protein VJ761_14030 [Ktedonobacteraceae bacterium]|nr:hypothetical protein [Ktedonobacteraceae bacterium]
MNTRSIILIGALIVVILGAAGFGLAFAVSHMGAGTATVTPTPTTAPTVVTTTKTKKQNSNKKYTGVIQLINTNSFVMTEIGKKAKTLTVMVNDSTTYSSTGGKITFSALKAGEVVVVKGALSGQTLTAVSVTVTYSGGTPTP